LSECCRSIERQPNEQTRRLIDDERTAESPSGHTRGAGYQNRDKIADVLRGKQGRQPQDGDAPDATDKENGRLSGVFGEQGGFGELLKGLRLAAS